MHVHRLRLNSSSPQNRMSKSYMPPRGPVRIITVVALLALGACGGGGGSSGGSTGGGNGGVVTPPDGPSATQYQNPVIDADFPDPGVVKANDGSYYAYATQTTGLRIQVASSPNLVTWGTRTEALPTKPGWTSSTSNYFAPDVSYRENRYVMYYAAQADTTAGTYCIGMAQSTAPAGPFVDIGHPLVCGAGRGNGDFTTIDPQGFDDPNTGKRYLFWGSGFAPIQVQELAADRASFAPGSSPTPIVVPRAGQPYENLVEGVWVTYHAPYYYVFYSGDACCGTGAHYAVMVGRSSNVTGPYEFRRTSTNGPAVPVLVGGTPWTAPGHNSVIHAGNDDWMLYHAININNPYLNANNTNVSRRPMLLDKINYQTDGWPVVGPSGVPTSTPQTRPTVP